MDVTRSPSASRRVAAAGGRVRWDRLGRVALLLVMGGMLYLYIGPARQWVATYREAERKRAEVHALRVEHRRLLERRRELAEPAALEREARKLGMVREGERAYVIEGLPGRR